MNVAVTGDKMEGLDPDIDQNILARALYDNEADSFDELNFRKGELLTVLQRNIPGMAGWWLCSIRGTTGKCPANRLQIVMMKDILKMTNKSLSSSHSAFDFSQITKVESNSTTLPSNKRQSWHWDHTANQDPSILYDVPRESCQSSDSLGSNYDLPKSVTKGFSSIRLNTSFQQEDYDVPRNHPAPVLAPQYDVPASQRDMLSTYDHPQKYLSGQSNSSADSSYADYDVPGNNAPVHQQVSDHYDVPPSSSSCDGTDSCFHSASEYDVPIHSFIPQAHSITFIPPSTSPLGSGKSKARCDSLRQLKKELLFVLRRMLSQIQPRWRERKALEPKIMEYRMNVVILDSKMKEVVDYDNVIRQQMTESDLEAWSTILETIKESSKLIGTSLAHIEAGNWCLPALCRDSYSHVPDDLDAIIGHAQNLTEILRSTFDFINSKCKSSWDRNVNGEVSEEGKNEEDDACSLRCGERQIIKAFIERMEIENIAIMSSVQNFFNIIRSNQPPKVFSEAIKSLLLNCYQVVYIGDAMCCRLMNQELYGQVQKQCKGICTALTTMVQATKTASHNFPNILAVQNMIYSVVDVSFLIRNFRALVISAAIE